jgi:hypothetical protein
MYSGMSYEDLVLARDIVKMIIDSADLYHEDELARHVSELEAIEIELMVLQCAG